MSCKKYNDIQSFGFMLTEPDDDFDREEVWVYDNEYYIVTMDNNKVYKIEKENNAEMSGKNI